GSCTVIVKGQAIRSCITPVAEVAGSEITTLEGPGTIEKTHPIQKTVIHEQGMHCGVFINAMNIKSKRLLSLNPKATDAEIRQAMSGVLCRCHGHGRMIRAIKRYGQEVKA